MYLYSFIPTYIHTYFHTFIHTYILSYIRTYIQARSERTMEYFSSVNFENRQKVRDYEELSTNFSLENEAMKRDRDARPATSEPI